MDYHYPDCEIARFRRPDRAMDTVVVGYRDDAGLDREARRRLTYELYMLCGAVRHSLARLFAHADLAPAGAWLPWRAAEHEAWAAWRAGRLAEARERYDELSRALLAEPLLAEITADA